MPFFSLKLAINLADHGLKVAGSTSLIVNPRSVLFNETVINTSPKQELSENLTIAPPGPNDFSQRNNLPLQRRYLKILSGNKILTSIKGRNAEICKKSQTKLDQH